MPEYEDITEVPQPSLEKGFYYHYKHDPAKGFNDYAYEVLGTSRHTETKTLSMVYRPLYPNTYLDVEFSNRPLAMAMSMVEVDGEQVFRFRKIEDQELIAKLTAIKEQMYPA